MLGCGYQIGDRNKTVKEEKIDIMAQKKNIKKGFEI